VQSLRINHRAQGKGSASGVAAVALAVAGLALPLAAHASFLPPELMDKAAMGVAWFVIIFVPIGAIVLFWLVHVLPEKIAHKRHPPQRDAIQRAVQQQSLALNAARTTLLRVQSERLVQRVNLHLAVGGSFEARPAAPGPQASQ